jgi:hypothetical protein
MFTVLDAKISYFHGQFQLPLSCLAQSSNYAEKEEWNFSMALQEECTYLIRPYKREQIYGIDEINKSKPDTIAQ